MESHYPPIGSSCRVKALTQYPLPEGLSAGSDVVEVSAPKGQPLVTVRSADGIEAELLRVNLDVLPELPRRMRS
jgi:hypothetical protein